MSDIFYLLLTAYFLGIPFVFMTLLVPLYKAYRRDGLGRMASWGESFMTSLKLAVKWPHTLCVFFAEVVLDR